MMVEDRTGRLAHQATRFIATQQTLTDSELAL